MSYPSPYSSYQPTGAYYIRKLLQYVPETTYGTTPTASPSFTQAGVVQDISNNTTMTTTQFRQLGNRDFYKNIKTGEQYAIQIKYLPVSKTMMAYGVNLAGGSGTVGESISMLLSQDINTTENYVLFKGTRTESIDIEVTIPSVMVTQNFVCQDVTTPNTAHGLTTPSFASAITTVPWTGANGGTNALTINGVNYAATRFKVTVSSNLDKVQPIGQSKLQFLEPTNRAITVDFDVVLKDTTSLADLKTVTARAATYSLDTGSSTTLTMTDLYLEKYSSVDSATANNVKMASFSGVCANIAI